MARRDSIHLIQRIMYWKSIRMMRKCWNGYIYAFIRVKKVRILSPAARRRPSPLAMLAPNRCTLLNTLSMDLGPSGESNIEDPLHFTYIYITIYFKHQKFTFLGVKDEFKHVTTSAREPKRLELRSIKTHFFENLVMFLELKRCNTYRTRISLHLLRSGIFVNLFDLMSLKSKQVFFFCG